MLKPLWAYLWTSLQQAGLLMEYRLVDVTYRMRIAYLTWLAGGRRAHRCTGCDARRARAFTCYGCGGACCNRCQRGTLDTPVCAVCALRVWLGVPETGQTEGRATHVG